MLPNETCAIDIVPQGALFSRLRCPLNPAKCPKPSFGTQLKFEKYPLKHPEPCRGPLERARAPDQQPMGLFVGMGPLELDGAPDEEPIDP